MDKGMRLQPALEKAFGLDAGSEFKVSAIYLLRSHGMSLDDIDAFPEEGQVRVESRTCRRFLVIKVVATRPHVVQWGEKEPPVPIPQSFNA